MSFSIEKKSMSQNKIFFDTNVLVYAHDESASYHTASALLLKMALENQIQGVIAEQNIIELYRILTNRAAMKGTPLTPEPTQDLIKGTYLSGAFEVIYPVRDTLDRTLQLAVSGHVLSARIFDVRLAALILETDVDYLATYNVSHFRSITGLNSLTPQQILAKMKA